MSEPLVALAQPSSGRSVPYRKAARGFLRPTERGTNRIELEQGTSMLPRCFNMLWCDALNHRAQYPITHFAMIHDDVGPDGPWLDVLLDELERTGADCISAVVPIKNEYGVTSTAIDTPGDPWVVRRLTMREAYDLPETFGAEDVSWRKPDMPLLINTGLWICKFDPAWVEKVCFRFINRIIQAPDGQFVSQDIPEDWDFGRQLASFGCKVMATRKVPIEHEHPRYHNRHPWGTWPTDLGFLQYTRQWGAASVPNGWRFPEDVDGWLSDIEARALADLAREKSVLEIGSYCGRSTISMAQVARLVCAVDPFDGRATTKERPTLPEFMENVVRYGVLDRVSVHAGTAEEMVPSIAERFDVAFVDGDHRKHMVLKDARLALSVLKPGGLLAFHDYQRHGDEGVTAAVNELIASGASLLALHDTVAVLKPSAA